MKIKNRLVQENNEFKIEWENRKKLGAIRFILFNFIKFFLFAFAIILGSNLINHKFQISISDFCIIILISIMAPILSWFINENRYKKINNK